VRLPSSKGNPVIAALLTKLRNKTILPSWWKKLQVAVPALIFVLCFSILGYGLYKNWTALAAFQWEINYLQVALSFILYTFDLTLAVSGWSLIVSKLAGVSNFRKNLKIYCYSNIASRLPGTVWYIISRAYLYEQQGIAKSVISIGSLLEMVLIILSGVFTYFLFLPFLSPISALRNPLPLIAILLLGLLLTHPAILGAILQRFARGKALHDLRYQDTLVWLGIYVVVWIVGGLVLFSAVNVFYPLPLTQLPGVIGAWTLSGVAASLVFLSPSGLGIRELTLSFLLSHYIPTPLAIVVALGTRVGLTVYEAFWAVVALKL
jgi:hypothetical protein